MTSSLAFSLESARAAMAELESLEFGIVEELESVARKSHKSKLAQELRLRNMIEAGKDRAKRIRSLQSESLAGKPPPNQGGLTEFMKRKQHLDEQLKDVDPDLESLAFMGEEDPHQVARASALGGELTFEDPDEERAMLRPKNRLERRMARGRVDEFVLSHEQFTGEEHLGRYLDLHEHHLRFQNLVPSFRTCSYLEYLKVRLTTLPPNEQVAQSAQYAVYLKELKSYLDEFERRATPLVIVSEGGGDGQDREGADAGLKEKPFEAELKRATNAGDLEKSLSMQQLKEALSARGLKASGTAQQRAARLFAIKNLTPDQYPLELLPAGVATGSSSLHVDPVSDIKGLEAKVKQSLDRLRSVIQTTQQMVTKKLTMTYEEIAQELREEEHEQEAVEKSDAEDGLDGNDDDDDADKLKQSGVIDPTTGRLIPKWMYRLRGLNQEFKCEICGGQSYFGRRSYDRHFRDFKHANGMRALGIPNTLHFHDITKIEDAKQLYASLKKELEKSGFNKQVEEEFEDSQGNVLSKTVFEDLKREGLL